MTFRRFVLVVTLAVAGLAFGSPARADEPISQREDEARSIVERIKLYRERHGINGELGSSAMLERTRWGYERWLDAERKRTAGSGDGWVSLGPVNGAGRMTALAPHPERDGTVLAGAASGGVWKTEDHGLSWRPLSDGLSDLSVGALTFAPSNSAVVYLGSGEAGLGSFFVPGIGLLRSDDGGETWFLPEPSQIPAEQFFALTVDPRSEDRVLAATERGLVATADGGLSWELQLGHPDLLGVTEVVRSAADPDRLWAALWCFGRCPAGLGRVMTTADGGATWTPASAGLPDPLFNNLFANRISLAVAPSNEHVLYVGLNTSRFTSQGPEAAVYRSSDGGQSWQATGDPGPYLLSQGWYDNAITVDPDDPDRVVAAGVWYVLSTDGGASWTTMDPIAAGDWMGTDTLPHVDGHAFAWQNGKLWLGCDGGVWVSADGGETWDDRNDSLVTRQYYGLAIDPIRSDRLLGGTQDNKTNLRLGPGDDDWEWVLDGDGFECAVNPLAPDLVYGTIYGTLIFRSFDGGSVWENISPSTGGDPTPFATPLTMRDDTPWQLYTGSSRVWRSNDAGSSWKALGTEVVDGQWSTEVVRAVALTATDAERIMVGKGPEVYTSVDGGSTWRRSAMETIVNNVAISPFDRDTALVCLARTPSGEPQMLRTTDGGRTWHEAAAGLPPFAVQVARWDPGDPAVAYAGTDGGLYRTIDGGVSWIAVGDGLPMASIHDLRIAGDGSRLVVATHGRGIWELALADPVGAAPAVELTGPDSAVLGDTVRFHAAAADADGDVLNLRWLISDGWRLSDGGSGGASMVSDIDHVFAVGGRYLVAANAVDATGRAGFDSMMVTAFEPGDDCGTPRVIPGDGPFPHTVLTDNRDTAVGPDDPQPPCTAWPGYPDSGRLGSIWFEFTPAESGSYSFSTCGSRSDTALSAWTGPSCGPFQPVPGGCSDDDELANCSGSETDSWIELALDAGVTIRLMVGVTDDDELGRLRLTVDCTSCRPGPDHRTLLVPAAAHSPGSGGTSWTTLLQLVNPGPAPATTEIRLLPGPGSAAGSISREIAAGGALDLEDVVGALLAGNGAGALMLESSSPVLATTRTATTGADGSYGQGIPVVSPEYVASDGDAVRLFGLLGTPDFRTNLGLVNPGDDPVSLAIRLYDSEGEFLAELEQTLGPGSWLQLNRLFEIAGTGSVTDGFAVIRQTSLGGRFFAYASVVDERTGDPTYLAPAAVGTPDTPLYIPAVAHTRGVGGAQWESDLVLFNPGEGDVVTTIDLITADGVVATTNIHIPGFWTLRLPDVVAGALSSDGVGALRLRLNRALLMVTSRTYSATPGGSYGQGIPGIAASSVLAQGDRGLLPGIRQDSRFRTNIGFVNTGEAAVDVDVTANAADGRTLGTLSFRLEPSSWRQANQALPRDTAFAVVTSDTPGAAYLSYASVVDRETDDPTYIQAVPVVEMNR